MEAALQDGDSHVYDVQVHDEDEEADEAHRELTVEQQQRVDVDVAHDETDERDHRVAHSVKLAPLLTEGQMESHSKG